MMRRRLQALIYACCISGAGFMPPAAPAAPAGHRVNQTTSAESFHLRATLSGPSVRLGYGWSAPMAFSPDGRTLAVGSHEGSIGLWDVATGALRVTLSGHRKWVFRLAFSPDGKMLASGSGDRTARLWDTETGRLLATLNGHKDAPFVSFSSDGARLATGSIDEEGAKVWEVKTGLLIATLPHEKLCAYCGTSADVAFSSDGRTLATSNYRRAYLWDTADWKLRTALVDPRLSRTVPARNQGRWAGRVETDSHADSIYLMLVSPDGRRLATGSRDSTAKLWDVVTGELEATLKHEMAVTALAFSRDSKILATGSADRSARLWDVGSGKLLSVLEHKGTVWSLSFSPDGKLVATGSDNQKTVSVWDTSTGKLLETLSDSRYPVAFSPDGRALATAKWGHPGTVLLWDVPVSKAREEIGSPAHEALR